MLLPYARTYHWLSEFQRQSGPLNLEIRLQPAHAGENLDGLRLYLIGRRINQEIAVGPQDEIVLPVRPDAVADQAELFTNRKPGDVDAMVTFWFPVPNQPLPAKDLRILLEQSSDAMRPLGPWFRQVQLANPFRQQEGALFVLPPGNRAELNIAGQRYPLTVEAETGHLELVWRDEWLQQPTAIHFSAPPRRVLPFFGPMARQQLK